MSLLGYADDTLILVAAEDMETAKNRAEMQALMTIGKIKTLNLKVATEKTEVVVFKKKKNRYTELDII